jgi:MOSC domain-containing protein YiiM
MMRIVSVNVGRPREIVWGIKVVRTGIFKEPIAGRVRLRRTNLEGDAQADLSVHGGLNKAVYAYPLENYAFWREQIPGRELPLGMFGENLTLAGLTEDSVYIGDELRIGTARLVITEPRLPCYKLGIRFGDPAVVPLFLASKRPGFYLSVLEEGEIGVGDAVEWVHERHNKLSVVELFRLMTNEKTNIKLLKRALRAGRLASALRAKIGSWLLKATAPSDRQRCRAAGIPDDVP